MALSNIIRNLSKLAYDCGKLSGVAAFITPSVTSAYIDSDDVFKFAFATATLILSGLYLDWQAEYLAEDEARKAALKSSKHKQCKK